MTDCYRSVNTDVGEKPLWGAAGPTVSLCDCVAPYAAIPLEGAAGRGVSGWMYPLLSMRLQEKTEQCRGQRANEKPKTPTTLS